MPSDDEDKVSDDGEDLKPTPAKDEDEKDGEDLKPTPAKEDAEKKPDDEKEDGKDEKEEKKEEKEEEEKEEPKPVDPEVQARIDRANKQVRCGTGKPGWAGIIDELCALGGEVIVCGAPALGYYRPGNAVDLCYLSPDKETVEKDLEALRNMKRARPLKADGATITFATIDVHVRVNDYTNVVRTQLLREYILREPKLPQLIESLIKWGQRKAIKQFNDWMWAWIAIAALVDSGALTKLRMRTRDNQLKRSEAEKRLIGGLPPKTEKEPKKVDDSDLEDEPEEMVSVPFPTAEQLQQAASEAEHDLWPRVQDNGDEPANADEKEILKLRTTVLEFLGKKNYATGIVSLHGREGFRGVEDPVSGQVQKCSWPEAVAMRRDAWRDSDPANEDEKEAEEEKKGDDDDDDAEGKAKKEKIGPKPTKERIEFASLVCPKWKPGYPVTVSSGRKKATVRADVTVDDAPKGFTGKERLKAQAVIAPLEDEVSPWDKKRAWLEATCVMVAENDYEIEVDLNTSKEVADKTAAKGYIYVRDLARDEWATTNAVAVLWLNCPKDDPGRDQQDKKKLEFMTQPKGESSGKGKGKGKEGGGWGGKGGWEKGKGKGKGKRSGESGGGGGGGAFYVGGPEVTPRGARDRERSPRNDGAAARDRDAQRREAQKRDDEKRRDRRDAGGGSLYASMPAAGSKRPGRDEGPRKERREESPRDRRKRSSSRDRRKRSRSSSRKKK